MNNKYCNTLEGYSRWKTRVVHVGQVPMGGAYPIRIQSMTNTNTMDTIATAEQCYRLATAGADYVRITAPTIKEAENLAEIKKMLMKLDCRVPLIADIHFNPDVAEIAAKHVEKIRINPGNFIDKKTKIEYTDSEYEMELQKIRERLKKLIDVCKIYKTAIRIGVNHGSLSNRIMSRFGDTPRGMVESAMEFLRIIGELNYHELVVSLKASNTKLMVQATRLLVNTMMKENMNYPLHLGVTEAGDAEDGRIKSAVGIGSLLADGLGDTVRVSLAEDPEAEVPVAQALVDYYSQPVAFANLPEMPIPYNPFESSRRETIAVEKVGGSNPPIVVTDLSQTNDLIDIEPNKLGLTLRNDGLFHPSENAPDYIFSGDKIFSDFSNDIKQIVNYSSWKTLSQNEKDKSHALYTLDELNGDHEDPRTAFLYIRAIDLTPLLFDVLKRKQNIILVVGESRNAAGFHEQRKVISALTEAGFKHPAIIFRAYFYENPEDLMLHSAADTGALFLDGLADGIWLGKTEEFHSETLHNLSFNILQASRVRITKTEFIACPSCGRTLFNLQETLAKVKAAVSHLKGLKIAVMGCIVNGPGEMADADYGYVGAASGKISLYKGKELIKTNLEADDAVNELVSLIKQNGDWK